MIIKYIKEFNVASRDDLDKLLMEKLSTSLSDKQKRTKIKNLIYEMSKKDKSIYNRSLATSRPEWILN
jgi:ATP-dependent DNA helicase RecG